MKPSALFLLLFVFFLNLPNTVLAHGNDHNDHEEIVEVYQTLVQVFRNRLFNTQNVPPQNIGYIETAGGRRIPINLSAMNELMALAVMNYDVEGHSCDKSCRRSLLAEATKFMVKLPFGMAHHIVSLPFKVIHFMGRPVTNTKELLLMIEGFGRRTARGYDPTLFTLIVLSQGAWETIESIVMPGGVHLFCTAFNTALLAATVPLERIVKLASNANKELSITQRLGYSVQSLLRTIRLWAFDTRTMYVEQANGRQLVSRNNFQINNANMLERQLMHQGFFPAVYAANMVERSQELKPSFDVASLEADLNFIFNTNEPAEARMYVAFTHTGGLSVLVTQLEKMASEVLEEKLLPRREYLQLEDYTGRLRRAVANYTASLLLYGTSDLTESGQEHLRSRYLRWLEHALSSLQAHGENLAVLHEGKDVHKFSEAIARSNHEALNLLNRLKVLRSYRASAHLKVWNPNPQEYLFPGCGETFNF